MIPNGNQDFAFGPYFSSRDTCLFRMSIPVRMLFFYTDLSFVLQSALGDKKWLQHKLIESLVEFDDIEEAVRWTRYYCLPLESVHPLVKDLVESW